MTSEVAGKVQKKLEKVRKIFPAFGVFSVQRVFYIEFCMKNSQA